MKTSRLLVSTALLIALLTGAFAKCLRPSNFSWPPNLEPVDCEIVHEQGPPEGRSAMDREMVQITVDCSTVSPRFCDKVKMANKEIAGFITSTFLLREPITISMKFDELERMALGGNVPGKFIPAQDSDQRIRLYPQALYKQFQFPQHPKYDDFDIHIVLNKKMLWHFPSDSPFMFAVDNSFTWTALHEILHGMGFGSCWYHRRLALLPMLIVSGIGNPDTDCFIEVRECAFDRYLQTPLVLGDPPLWGPVSQFVHDYVTHCSTEEDLWEKFESTSSYQFGIKLLEAAEIEGRFNIRLPNYPAVILESGVPYSPGRTLHHVEQATYQDTEDFLMTPYAKPGTELNNITARFKGKGPIGKSMVAILNTMGYPTPNNPNPEKPKYIDPDT